MQNISSSNIYFFNPTCEYAIANGNTTWQPNKILQKMEDDLATLPLFFAHKNDTIIVPNLPSQAFLEHLLKIGIQAPSFILKQNFKAANTNFPVNKIIPWGWSPAVHTLLAPFKPNCSDEFKRSPVFNWKSEYKDLYSKKFAREILKRITTEFPSEHFIDQNQIAEICTSQRDFENLLDKWGLLMVKAPWSSSGRGLQPITKIPVHAKVWEKVLGFVKEQGYAIVEPYLDKVIDLAFQFEIKKGKVTYLGISNFSTDYKGQYNGNSLNGLPDTLSNEIKEFVQLVPSLTLKPLIKTLESSILAKQYEGVFGVDTLIFRNAEGQLKVNPCLEINVRYTMGLLSVLLEEYLCCNKRGLFRTYFKPGTSFFTLKNEMEKKYPLVLNDGKIESGFFPLVEANEDTLFGAYLLV